MYEQEARMITVMAPSCKAAAIGGGLDALAGKLVRVRSRLLHLTRVLTHHRYKLCSMDWLGEIVIAAGGDTLIPIAAHGMGR